MTTIVNTPARSEGGGFGLLGAILLIAFLAFLLFYFGIPAINRARDAAQVTTPQINVPREIDVNVNSSGE